MAVKGPVSIHHLDPRRPQNPKVNPFITSLRPKIGVITAIAAFTARKAPSLAAVEEHFSVLEDAVVFSLRTSHCQGSSSFSWTLSKEVQFAGRLFEFRVAEQVALIHCRYSARSHDNWQELLQVEP